jgi:linoleoyl-CoA desaturase
MSKIQPRYRYKIHDKIYDLSDFVKIHPGGQDMFNNLKQDTNITTMVYSYHKNPKNILAMLPKYEVPLTDDIIIKYDTDYTYDKYCELKKLVYDEIQEKKIPIFWSNKEIAYNLFMLSLYLGIWSYCIYNHNNLSYWWMVFLGFYVIGFNALVFHETSHYTGFKNQKINTIISYYVVYPFLSVNEWKERHNYLHHSFTNTEYDTDFDKNKFLLRHSNKHTHYNHHKLQYFYACILFLLNGYNKTIIRNIKVKDYFPLLGVIFVYYCFGIINALVLFGFVGFGYTFIANLSHIQYECIQINTDKKKDFLYNQISSSINYKTDDIFTRFICFGLDIQIEHHLFPNIPHSSIRKIQHIVSDFCRKNDIPYIEKSSMLPTMISYLKYLYQMGNPKFYNTS